MRKKRIVLAAVFLAGALLGGIGAGLTVVEWSSLEYGGQKLLGSEHLVTEDFDFKLKEDGSKIVLGPSYETNRWLEGVGEDPSVPEGVIRYRVTYNNTLITPRVEYTEYDRAESSDSQEGEAEPSDLQEGSEEMPDLQEEPEELSDQQEESEEISDLQEGSGEPEASAPEPVLDGVIRLTQYFYGDEGPLLMENKDKILNDLKQGKISSYEIAKITGVKILINPATAPRVENRMNWGEW